MPPGLDDRNDQITLSCLKIRYNEKKIDIFVTFLYFCRHIEKMANSSLKLIMGSESVDKNTIAYAFSK